MAIVIDDLKQSNEFLNILLDSITSAVFVVDREVRLHSFNDSFKALFRKGETQLLGELCGNAMGCAFAVTEDKKCGETSNCDICELRKAMLGVFSRKIPAYKEKLTRVFFIDGAPVKKHFLVSTRNLPFEGDDMAVVIVDDVTETENQRLRLMEDLEAAGEVQRCLLPPSTCSAANMEAAWEFMPSHSIGGDIFNFFMLDGDHMAAYMLDVSGHGAPSAMVAALASQALLPRGGYIMGRHNEAATIASPAKVLAELDRDFPISRFERFFTMNYLVCDLCDGEIVYSSAAHPAPIVQRADGGLEFLEKGGSIVGLGGGFPFEEGRATLSTGDRLFLYTDGIPEYRNKDGEFHGVERFLELIGQSAGMPLKPALSWILARILEFGDGRPPQDDVSLLAFEFSPSPDIS